MAGVSKLTRLSTYSIVLFAKQNGIKNAGSLIVPVRKIMVSPIRRELEPDEGPYMGTGSNLPFRMDNKYRLWLLFTLYWGSAFGFPFFCVHYVKSKE